MGESYSPLPDGRDWWMEAVFWVVLVPLVVFSSSMLYVQVNPGAPWQLQALYSNTVGELSSVSASTGEEEVLKLSQSDARYLNRVYRELNTEAGDRVGEQAYCIDVVGDHMSVQQAGTLEADEDSVTFTVANCFGVPDGIAHFHPPGSQPVLSGPETAVNGGKFNDKKTLLESPYRFSCVQAGLMTVEPGSKTSAFRCYGKPSSGEFEDEFPRIQVKVVE